MYINLLIKKLNAIAHNKHYNEMTFNFHANNAKIAEEIHHLTNAKAIKKWKT